MICRSNTHASTSSTATGASILSQSTLLTNSTSIASNFFINKGLAALVNLPPVIYEAAYSRRPSLAVAEPTPIQSEICQKLTADDSSSIYSTTEITTPSLPMAKSTLIHSVICQNLTANDSSPIYSTPEATTSPISPVSIIAPISVVASISPIGHATGMKAAISRYSTARQHRKNQKSAAKAVTKAAGKEKKRSRARAYFADFYADDKVGAWHNAPATNSCSCGCNDSPLNRQSGTEDPVPVADLMHMHNSQVDVIRVTRMVDGRPVMINF